MEDAKSKSFCKTKDEPLKKINPVKITKLEEQEIRK